MFFSLTLLTAKSGHPQYHKEQVQNANIIVCILAQAEEEPEMSLSEKRC